MSRCHPVQVTFDDRPTIHAGITSVSQIGSESEPPLIPIILQPAIEFLTGKVVDEVGRRIIIGVFKIDAMFGIGIGLVDPVDKRLFIPDDEKITIEHGWIPGESPSEYCKRYYR